VDAAGIGCEPASAAAVAGTRQLARAGRIARGARVIGILTGHLLKDPQAVLDYHRSRARRANPPIEIAPRLAEVEKVLRRS
jgi:threonine synthase